MAKIDTATPNGAPADASGNAAAPLSDDEALLAAFEYDEDTPDDVDDEDESDEDSSTDIAPEASDDDSDEATSEDAPVAPTPKKTAAELEEERRAGLRLEDYTQKTMQLAEERRQAEAARQQYAERLELLDQMLASSAQEPNWDEMRITHTPEEVNEAFTNWSIAERKRAQVQRELERERAKTAEQMQKAHMESVAQETARLRSLLPEGKSDEAFQSRVTHLTRYGLSQGFTADELAGTTDHRAILLLDKAERYDALMAKARKKDGKTVPVAPSPVASAKPTRAVASDANAASMSRQEKELRARLTKTGDPRAAEELFYRKLGGS